MTTFLTHYYEEQISSEFQYKSHTVSGRLKSYSPISTIFKREVAYPKAISLLVPDLCTVK